MKLDLEGPLSAAWFALRHRGELRAVVVVNAGLRVEGGGLVVAPPEPVLPDDRHHYGNPTWSVERPSDLAPYLPRCDVLLLGHALPDADEVRLAVGRGAVTLLDKRVRVERRPQQAARRVPLVYEEALGGPGHPRNPVGSRTPSLVNPVAPSEPIGFGAIPRHGPERSRFGGLPRPAPGASLDVPEGFAWEALQAAPRDQQLQHLTGDEWVLVSGASAEPLRVTLPSVRVVASPELRFACDGLIVDAKTSRLTLRFRALVPFAELGERVRLSLEVAGAPATAVEEPPRAPPAAAGAWAGVSAGATLGVDAAPGAEAMPFVRGSPWPGAVVLGPAAGPAPAAGQTLALDDVASASPDVITSLEVLLVALRATGRTSA